MLVLSYEPLWKAMKERQMVKEELRRQGIVNNSTFNRIINGEPVSITVLMQICDALDIPVERVIEFNKV